MATGSDGYKAVISEGEIDPKFGNKSDQVAYADTLNQLPNPNGFTRIVAAGDIAGGRYVSNLTNIAVVATFPRAWNRRRRYPTLFS